VRLGKYLKSAFTNPWNLLAFVGALGFAVLSGAPAVFIPLVLAGEIGYVSLLGGNTRYQKYVEAQDAKATRVLESESATDRRNRIISALPEHLVERFEALRSRCLEIRRIAMNLKSPDAAISEDALDELQLEGLDRLLWIYLRLLHAYQSIECFLATTTEQTIVHDIERLEARLASQSQATPKRQKIIETLEDNLQTCRDRLANRKKVQNSYELMELEIDRLENKIQTLSEMAINRQEHDYIVSQVDLVASSMLETEQAMNEITFATGFNAGDDQSVPALLRPETTQSHG